MAPLECGEMVPLQGRGHRGEGNWEELLEESDEEEEGSEGEEEESEKEEEEEMTVAMAAVRAE